MAHIERTLKIDRRAVMAMLFAAGAPTAARSNPPEQSGSKVPQMRATPLFASEADARAVIKRYCIDEADDPIALADVELLIARLRPYFWIEARKTSEASKFKSHFGGAPELPPGASWPMRPPVLDTKPFIDRVISYRKEASWLSRYIADEVPFEFIAQIDLLEAAQFPTASDGLPTSGRLLFFWDDAVGSYAGGQAACKVIFDETPIDQITALKIPSAFAELERSWIAAEAAGAKETFANLKNSLPETIEILRKSGADQASIDSAKKALEEQIANPPPVDPNLKKPFVYPRRAMKLTALWHIPHTHTPEVITDAQLQTFLKVDTNYHNYHLLLSNDEGPFDTNDKFVNEARRHRFLGTPVPEQDDPRYDAAFGIRYPSESKAYNEVPDADKKASEWRLLLQIAVADLAQVLREGTIYFLINSDDLAKRDFSQVAAYYQQT